jgi:hypothetical protein
MFTMMIIMAIVTTCMTAPSVHLMYKNRRQELLGDDDVDTLPACQRDVNTSDAAATATAAAAASCSSAVQLHAASKDDVCGAGDKSSAGAAAGDAVGLAKDAAAAGKGAGAV